MVTGWLPVNQILNLPNLANYDSVTPVYKPEANVGSYPTDADPVIHSDTFRTAEGVDGTGVKVGVISTSVNQVDGGLAQSEATGDVAPNVQVLEDDLAGGGSDEGRAMLEIVHHIAPGASEAFHSGFNGAQDMANGIQELVGVGARAITDDITYFDEPMFNDGVIAQAAESAVAQGVLYTTSAGNNSNPRLSRRLGSGHQYHGRRRHGPLPSKSRRRQQPPADVHARRRETPFSSQLPVGRRISGRRLAGQRHRQLRGEQRHASPRQCRRHRRRRCLPDAIRQPRPRPRTEAFAFVQFHEQRDIRHQQLRVFLQSGQRAGPDHDPLGPVRTTATRPSRTILMPCWKGAPTSYGHEAGPRRGHHGGGGLHDADDGPGAVHRSGRPRSHPLRRQRRPPGDAGILALSRSVAAPERRANIVLRSQGSSCSLGPRRPLPHVAAAAALLMQQASTATATPRSRSIWSRTPWTSTRPVSTTSTGFGLIQLTVPFSAASNLTGGGRAGNGDRTSNPTRPRTPPRISAFVEASTGGTGSQSSTSIGHASCPTPSNDYDWFPLGCRPGGDLQGHGDDDDGDDRQPGNAPVHPGGRHPGRTGPGRHGRDAAAQTLSPRGLAAGQAIFVEIKEKNTPFGKHGRGGLYNLSVTLA